MKQEDLKVWCREVQISQVLLNLISNSCDAVIDSPEKWIRLSAERKDGKVEISVTDSGSISSQAIREKLFHPFFTTKDIGKGTGLGLSISKGIVEAHRGNLTFDFESNNTRFVLTLPETTGDQKRAA